jgi:hypothetical protein
MGPCSLHPQKLIVHKSNGAWVQKGRHATTRAAVGRHEEGGLNQTSRLFSCYFFVAKIILLFSLEVFVFRKTNWFEIFGLIFLVLGIPNYKTLPSQSYVFVSVISLVFKEHSLWANILHIFGLSLKMLKKKCYMIRIVKFYTYFKICRGWMNECNICKDHRGVRP